MHKLITFVVLLLSVVWSGAFWSGNAVATEELTLQQEEKIIQDANVISQAFSIIAKRVSPVVVNLSVQRVSEISFFARPQISNSMGTGLIVDGEKGLILTNHHVVNRARRIEVKLEDGRSFVGESVGSDPDSDVAVIRINAKGLPDAVLGNSDDCKVGEWVMAVGNAMGLESTFTAGIISAKGRSGVGLIDIEDYIQTDAAINPGNSGGPLINLKGEVIGINSAIATRSGGSQGVAFAIPINIARSIMTSLVLNNAVTHSTLGVTLAPLTEDIANAFGLSTPRGALVTSVLEGTPAAGKLTRGDVIRVFGRREIVDDQQLRNLIAISPPNEDIDIVVFREGKELNVKVRLETKIDPNSLPNDTGAKLLEALGITTEPLTDEWRQKLRYESGARGLLVVAVNPKGWGAKAIGLQRGSLILRVNNYEVNTLDDLRNALKKAEEENILYINFRFGAMYSRFVTNLQRK